jgi:hypothetical protein
MNAVFFRAVLAGKEFETTGVMPQTLRGPCSDGPEKKNSPEGNWL